MNKKKLPIGVQTFETMIRKKHVYVDKTAFLYRMAEEGMFYFLARPRRFGKSLTVSTLAALFEGRKELFKGLGVEKSDWQWQPHPVIIIDFNGIEATDEKTLERSLFSVLDRLAKKHTITLKSDLLPLKFVELLLELAAKYQEKIVVLVDEYDKPIITHLGEGETGLQTAQRNRAVLKKFFGVLYRLGYPNQEVKTAFSGFLYDSIVEVSDTVLKGQFKRLHQYLAREDLEQFIETANAILSAIPHTHPDALAKAQREAYYHTIFYLMVSASGVLVHSEALMVRGRMDMAVEFTDKVYIIELKCNQTAAKALAQIREKGYHEKYVQSGRIIILVGINFDTHKRGIADWRMETV